MKSHAYKQHSISIENAGIERLRDEQRPKKRLKRVSTKRAAQLREYAKIRSQFLREAPFCEAPGCIIGKSSHVHHSNHREGKRLLDRRYFVAVCEHCHRKIHSNPRWAREHGLLI